MNRPKINEALLQLKDKIFQNKKLLLIVSAGILGMLLIMFSSYGSDEPAKVPEKNEDIEVQMTNELTKLLQKVDGAGRVEVMLTFESSQEKIYAYDTDEDVESENNKSEERKTKSEHIIIKNESGEDGLKVKDIYPQIRGVAVICDGGADPAIKGQIIAMVSALFNINSTKISVAKMAS